MMMSNPRNLFEKVWDEHVVSVPPGGQSLLYIDLHLVHEVTSPQAFDGLRATSRRVRQPSRTVATVDHNVPTEPRGTPITDLIAARQIEALQKNCKDFGIRLFDINSPDQGIVHVIGPELGFTQPGMTIVCGDSHTSTHGALGSLAFGIGTSEVEHVLATQCLPQRKPKSMLIQVRGVLPEGVTAKDLALGIIGKIGTDGATGYVIEYAGEAVCSLSMEGRMTLCNMSIEAGARAGIVAPDDTTFAYVKDRRFAPAGAEWDQAVERWKKLPSDPGARYDRIIELDAASLAPFVTWGTNPGMVVPVSAHVPEMSAWQTDTERQAAQRMLDYMGLEAGTPVEQISIDRVFIGSCTNSRLEDLRAAARVVKAFLWIRDNTPVNAVFPLDPAHMKIAGEDADGFRAVAERSMLADSVKDSGAVTMFPPLAPEWMRQVQAQENWKNFQARDFGRLAADYGVTWVVLQQPGVNDLSCPYQNQAVMVCRLN